MRELQIRAEAEAALRHPRGLAALGAEQWEDVVRLVGAPPSTPGHTDDERTAAYARTVARAVEARFPTAVLAARIERGDFPAPEALRPVLSRFFSQNPGFELGELSVAAFTAAGGGAELGGIDDDELPALGRELHRLERIAKLVPREPPADHGPRHRTMGVLRETGFDSAQRIARVGQRDFVAAVAGKLDGGAGEAGAVYARAQENAALALALLVRYGKGFNVTDLPVLPAHADAVIPAADPSTGIPDLRTLFGSLDLCVCDDCRSVTAPAAYLVDLLQFLADRPLPGGGTLKDVILDPRRRPDLDEIELSCENTNRRLPYIDLVNEILENAVTPRPAGASYPQTTWTEPELAAGPEHVLVSAYAKLAGEAYPWSLPFDLPLEEVRAYLRQLGISRHQLMETLLPGERLTDVGIAVECLGFSKAEADIMTQATSAPPWAQWGLDEQVHRLVDRRDGATVSGVWYAVLRDRVSVLLQQSELTFAELLALVELRFVNPTTVNPNNTVPSIEGDRCDLTAMSLRWVTSSDLDRMHRFVRLWRRLGWSMQDVDRAIAAYAAADLTDGLLVWVAIVERLRATLNVPVALLVSWWTPLDTWTYADRSTDAASTTPSSYDAVFLRRSGSPTPSGLALNGARTELAEPWDGAHPQRTITANGPEICAALGVDGADLARLLAAGVPDELTLANLSRLHAVVSLARALRLGIADYLRLMAITVSDPLPRAATPAAGATATLRFVEEVGRLRDGGFTVAELDYLLRHQTSSSVPVAPPLAQVTQTLGDLRNGLRAVADQTRAEPDPHGERTRVQLAGLGWNAELVEEAVSGAVLNADPRSEVALAALPPATMFPDALPDPLRARVAFDSVGGSLSCLGALREAERDELLALPVQRTGAAYAAYETAVNELYAASRVGLAARLDFVRGRMQSFVLPTFRVPLELSADLAVLPAGVVFPDGLASRLSYDAGTGKLRLRGLLSAAEGDTLVEMAPGDAPFVAAIRALAVALDVPPSLVARCDYAPDLMALCFTGWLTDIDRALLRTLTSVDGWTAAIDGLSAASARYRESDPANQFLAPGDADALFYDARTPGERFAHVMSRLQAHLRTRAGEALVVEWLGSATGLDAETTRDVLLHRLPRPGRPREPAMSAFLDPAFAETGPRVPVVPATFPEQFAVFGLLHKIALVLGHLRIGGRQITTLLGPADWAFLAALPMHPTTGGSAAYAGWRRLRSLAALRDDLPAGADVLAAIFAAADDAAEIHPILETAASVLGCDRADLAYAVDGAHLNMSVPRDYRDPEKLARLIACLRALRLLGVSAPDGWALARDEMDADTSRRLREAMRARVDPATWLGRERAIRDVLRERQRAALVAHLVARDGLRDANELYGRYLIDVEMGPAMLTSRIRQAIAAVQLFVQRCQMNLETVETTPLFRLLSPTGFHFYTTSATERHHALEVLGWTDEGVACHVFAKARSGATSLFRLRSGTTDDHFYTISVAERYSILNVDHYVDEGVAGYVYAAAVPGVTTPLFRMFSEVIGDHFHTTSPAERDNAREFLNYSDEGTACHVFGAPRGGVAPSAILIERWRWLKTYRVWEANRKVFLYPENWLVPELRDDRSPFFMDLESELQQSDLRAETAERAFRGYLDKLDQVGRLEIAGACPQRSDGQELLHVVGRTFNTPHVHYYRCRIDRLRWTAWERIDLDIEGDHYLPVIWNGRLFLFWAKFAEVAEEPAAGQLQTPALPDKRWELQLAWSERRDGRWQATQLLRTPQRIGSSAVIAKPPAVVLAPKTTPDVLTVAMGYPDSSGNLVVYTWRFAQLAAGQARMTFASQGAITFRPAPWIKGPVAFSELQANSLVELPGFGQNPLQVQVAPVRDGKPDRESAPVLTTVLNRHPFGEPNRFRVLFPFSPDMVINGQGTLSISALSNDSFFFENRGRSYFAEHPPAQLAPHPALPEPLIFTPHFHPYITHFSRVLNTDGIPGLLALATQQLADSGTVRLPSGGEETVQAGAVFRNEMDPNPAAVAMDASPREIVDFHAQGAYSAYNWEIFFHVPVLIATRLSRNQRFEEAQRWFHYVFDPTDASDGPTPGRFWRTLPFHDAGQGTPIEDLLRLLADKGKPGGPHAEIVAQVDAWRRAPFNPHAIARWRTSAYQRAVVMAYLDNLIAWGDQLFRRDTPESVAEATQIYVLADQILGLRPELIPARVHPRTQTYKTLEPKLDEFSNALVEVEGLVAGGSGTSSGTGAGALPTPPTLYFGVPRNPKLLDYWDRVADRLFKVRNSMNIDGVVRQLSLFDPPIDPGLLVQAVAAGIDIGAVLAAANAPQPGRRFRVWSAKATELCGEVKALGAALLSALERRDAEGLALLRSTQEIGMLDAARAVREQQVEEAKATLEALGKGLELAKGRVTHYTSLLSAMETIGVPTGSGGNLVERMSSALVDLSGSLGPTVQAAKAVLQLAEVVGPEVRAALASLERVVALPSEPGPEERVSLPMSGFEKRQLDELKVSNEKQLRAMDYEDLARVLALVPDITVGAQGISSPVVQAQIGGTLLSTMARLRGSTFNYEANEHAYRANLHAILAGHQRRAEDWLHQAQTAVTEMEQIAKQMVAGGFRVASAVQELRNHDRQIADAHETDAYMREKFTNAELFEWLAGEISGVYVAAYQLAHDVAKRAEQAFRFELAAPDASFIRFGYWDGLRRGLLAGDRLAQDVRRMEVAYLDRDEREHELTQHVALTQLNPGALVRLKLTGECEVELPEAVFDLHHVGHYLRRLREVSISIPSVTGPYTGVPCTLTLLRSSIRTNPSLGAGYPRNSNQSGQPTDDPRFTDSQPALQSIVTSSGQHDSGRFEPGLRDERLAPFEGHGAISRWRIELPRAFRPFDYNTIADVVLHLAYTARDGGRGLADAAEAVLQRDLNKAMQTTDGAGGFSRLFSLRHEFTGWHRLVSTTGERDIELNLADRFPLIFRGHDITIDEVELFIRGSSGLAGVATELRKAKLDGTAITQLVSWGGRDDVLSVIREDLTWNPAQKTATFTLKAANPALLGVVEDVWLLCHYLVGPRSG
ncbi:neuraminidase-like domain-containing protein [Frankia sp. Cr2]|uniref:Tc toxin subunit A-related protein n=1 Tax=Frankia sp. Cr2 TaxID=3073932 RepID=UPI002AD4914D|nr:neuraminidase-like domain-containing protein [Frankia sp. Cr2]